MEDSECEALQNDSVNLNQKDEIIHNNSMWSFRKQLLVALVVGSCNFMQGFVEGWTANLPKIQDDNSTEFNLTMHDVQWLVSGMYLAALPSNLIGGLLGDFIGYKTLLTIILPIATVNWTVLAFTPNLILLYVARISQGVLFGLVSVLVSPLISEICEPQVRGFAVVIAELMLGVGVILGYLQAHLCYWRTATVLAAVPSVFTFIVIMFIPESPYWYMRHGKTNLAEKSLTFILGDERAHKKVEIMQQMRQSKSTDVNNSALTQFRLLRQPQNWKPLLLMMTIFFLREAGGKSSVFVYTVYIFRSAGVTIDPFICTLYVGVARLITVLLCALIIDRVGRKSIFMTCTFICVCCYILAGTVLVSGYDNLFTKWAPLIAVLLFTVSYCLGMSPIPWPLFAELLPLPVKPISVSLVCFTYSVSLFAMTNTFPSMLEYFGLGISYFIFAISYIILFIVLGLFLPETKGKSLIELEMAFIKKSKPLKTELRI